MNKSKNIFLFCCVAVSLAFSAIAGDNTRNSLASYSVQRMAPCADGHNPYSSLLENSDGSVIADSAKWSKRREQIKADWMSIIGKWGDVIKGKPMQFVDSVAIDASLTRYVVELEWLPGVKTTGYLLVPDGEAPRPAVITFFYEPETAAGLGTSPKRDFALQLARNGFITLSLGSTETTRDKTYGLYYPSIDNAVMEPLSAMAYAAANAYEALALDSRVDASRIGVMGHSYGGKWAMFASCLYDKFACAAWGDPGIVFDESKGGYINYWEPWYLGYRKRPWEHAWTDDGYLHSCGAYKQLRETGHDLHELHALMAPRPFLVSGGYSDGAERIPALMRSVEVNKMLGYDDRVFFTQRESHAPTDEANRVITDFFVHFLIDSPCR